MRLSIAGKAEGWTHRLSRTASWISIVVLVLMTFLVTIDVFGRYLLKRPIAGSLDIIEMMMVIMVYSGFAYCASVDGNVRVDVLYGRFPKRVQSSLDAVTSICSVFIVALITWQLGARAWNIVQQPPGPATGYFQWPLLPFIALASVGSGLLCLELLLWFFRSLYRAARGEHSAPAVEAKRLTLAVEE